MIRTLVFSGCADDILHTDRNCFDLALLVAEGCLTCFTAPAAVPTRHSPYSAQPGAPAIRAEPVTTELFERDLAIAARSSGIRYPYRV
jgi:hypothetical protein